MNAMRGNLSLPTHQAIQQWTFNELKDEFVGKQSSKARKSTLEGGDLTVMQSLQYLNSVLDRFEQLTDCPYSQKDVEAIKTVFQTRLDAITSENVPGDLLGLKRSIFDRVRGAMPTPRGRRDDLPFREAVRYAASEFFKFFSACKSGAFGSFLFGFNVCVVFYSSYLLFDAIDVAGPLMATFFYSLLVFAYCSRENHMLQLALFFCLLAFIIAVITGMFLAILAVAVSLLLLAVLKEGLQGAVEALKAGVNKLVRPPSPRFH
jgi:hypothetical protein